MNVERNGSLPNDKVPESRKPHESQLGRDSISTKEDNVHHERQQALNAAKSFKLTADGQVSFEIHGMLDGKELSVKDNRVLRVDSTAQQIQTDSITPTDDRVAVTHSHRLEKGSEHSSANMKRLIELKEQELHLKYGVTFSKPGESLGHQETLAGKAGAEIHARTPTFLELNAIEKALAVSDPAHRAADGHAVKFSFPDKQWHDGPVADADTQHHGDGGATEIRIFPEGVTAAHGNVTKLEHVVVHELSHNTIFKRDGMGDIVPEDITKKIGFVALPNENVVRGERGTLWRHFDSTDRQHWWTLVDNKGMPITKDGKPPNDLNVTSEPFSRHHLSHLSLIESKDGSYYSHELTNADPNRYWIKRDKDGHPLDKAGHVVASDALAYGISNDQMRNDAKFRPSSNYFDDAQEATVEAIQNFRIDKHSRKELQHSSPEYYVMAKFEDQREINNQYGLNKDGTPRKVRLPNGHVVQNDDKARAEIAKFEAAPGP